MRSFKTKPDYVKQYSGKINKDLNRVSTYRLIRRFVGDAKAILDVGCVTGYLLEFLGGGSGVDLDPELVELC